MITIILFSYLECNQIWPNHLLDYHYFIYITKFGKKKKKNILKKKLKKKKKNKKKKKKKKKQPWSLQL